MITTGRESLRLPGEFQDFLTRLGGRNPFGDPNYIVFWGETRVQFGILQDLGIPRWSLAGWEPPEKYGPEVLWPYDDLGAYPYRGEYEIIKPLYQQVGKKMIHMPLNYRSFEFLVPFIEKHKNDSIAERKKALLAAKNGEDAEIQAHIADVIQDAVPALGDQKGSFLRKKMEQIERAYGNSVRSRKQGPVHSPVVRSSIGG